MNSDYSNSEIFNFKVDIEHKYFSGKKDGYDKEEHIHILFFANRKTAV
jgi:hypothetical protein